MLETKTKNVFRYENCEDEGLVSIFVNDILITELSDEDSNPEAVFNWFVKAYSEANYALNYSGYINWQQPETIPTVALGTEKQFWVAVKIHRASTSREDNPEKTVTFLAQYQNRPYKEGDEDENGDEALVSTDGEYVASVGWVTCQSHCEFDNYYEPLEFNDSYKLLGWAEYIAPEFTSIN